MVVMVVHASQIELWRCLRAFLVDALARLRHGQRVTLWDVRVRACVLPGREVGALVPQRAPVEAARETESQWPIGLARDARKYLALLWQTPSAESGMPQGS